MKKKLLMFTLALASLTATAQVKLPKWLSQVNLSGYVLTQYQYNGQEGAESNSFDLRMARLSLDGRVLDDFYWKIQLQVNGNTSTLGSSPRVVDVFAEWQGLDFLNVKIGQFKNPFTFENPMNPIDQGFMSYSQNVSKLAGFNDRAGAHASNGRDIGLQLQGDVLKNAKGRALVHYQVGVFNGQGINTKDVDQQKNLIGGLWVMPVKGMRLGVFGWTGSYARKGEWTEINPQSGVEETKAGVRRLPQRRYAFSAEYVFNDWTLRSEYTHSTGAAFAKALTNHDDENSKDCSLSQAGDKADGFYALAIAPIIQKKLHVKARYDLYRNKADWDSAKTLYEVGMDYEFHRNFQVSAEYAFVNDRSLAKHDYSMVDVQVSYRF